MGNFLLLIHLNKTATLKQLLTYLCHLYRLSL